MRHGQRPSLSLDAAKRAFWTEGDIELQRMHFGFRPVAVVAWWARLDEHRSESPNRGGIGFWTAEERAAVAWFSADGETTARTPRIADSVALIGVGDGEPAVTMQADLESFDDDGLTIRWRQPPSERWIVHCLALGGGSLRAARVGWGAPPPGTALSVRDPTADLLLAVPAASDGVASEPELEIGFVAASRRRQAAAGYVADADAAPGAVTGTQRSGASIAWPNRDRARVAYLALEGIRAEVATTLSPPTVGASRVRVGFRPQALLLFSWGLAPTDEPRNIGRLCLGGAAGGEHGCAGWDDRDIAAPETATHVVSSVDDMLIVSDTQTGGTHARAQVTSFDERGFTLDWTEADGKLRELVYVAMGASESRPAGRARRLAARISRS